MQEEIFKPWRTFGMGGTPTHLIQKGIQSGFFQTNNPAVDFVTMSSFRALETEEEIDTVVLTPAHLKSSRTKRLLTTDELFDEQWIADWSERNAHRLPDGYDAIDLLPAEAPLRIRSHYRNQPRRECRWVATERLLMSHIHSLRALFAIECDTHGERWLRGFYRAADLPWKDTEEIIYRLRRL